MEEKETFNQIQCNMCNAGAGLIPLYNKKNQKLKFYCPCCGSTWLMDNPIKLRDEWKLYENK